MITSLTILNILSHRNTWLEFSDGVNIIVGPTDSGKSAIIKALKWLVTNRPMGDGLRSHWGGRSVVEVCLDNDVFVRRYKGNAGNSYTVGDQSFNALKGDVPSYVSSCLNLSDINLQTQFDAHFLLTASSGEVAQYFNKIAHLNKIDTALQNIAHWYREEGKRLGYNEVSLKDALDKLVSYDVLDSIEKQLSLLEEKESERQTLVKQRQDLLTTVNSIKSVEEKIEDTLFLGDLEEQVRSLLEILKSLKEVKIRKSDLIDVVNKIEDVEKSLTLLEEKIHILEEQFHNSLGKGSVCPLCQQVVK